MFKIFKFLAREISYHKNAGDDTVRADVWKSSDSSDIVEE